MCARHKISNEECSQLSLTETQIEEAFIKALNELVGDVEIIRSVLEENISEALLKGNLEYCDKLDIETRCNLLKQQDIDDLVELEKVLKEFYWYKNTLTEFISDVNYKQNLSREIKNVKYLANIKLWFDNDFIRNYINPILKSNSLEIIDENHAYNFYYYYLLLFLTTFKNNRYSDEILLIDEFQDLSKFELELIKEININSAIELYGDFNQIIVDKNNMSEDDIKRMNTIYRLNNNYRNTIEITEYYNKKLRMNDCAIGIHGPSVDEYSSIPATLSKDSVIICSLEKLTKLKEEWPNHTVLSISNVKGLEFKSVCAVTTGMSKNEKYIAFSRALNQLVVLE